MSTQTTETFPIEFDLGNIHFTGNVTPLLNSKNVDGVPTQFSVELKDGGAFHLECDPDGCWHAGKGEIVARELVDSVGDYIYNYYN